MTKLKYEYGQSIGPRATLEKPYGTWSIVAPTRYTNYCFEIALLIDNDLVDIDDNDQIKRFTNEEEALTFIESYVP